MRVKQLLLAVSLGLFLTSALASSPGTVVDSSKLVVPQAGKQYQVLPDIPITAHNKLMRVPGKITVTEFFSYGCPACYHFEATLETWLKKKPSGVVFKRVPVVFESGWLALAKVYYTAQALHIADKMSPHIFNAVWKQGLMLRHESDVQNLFLKYGGVTAQEFKSVYEFTPAMANRLFRGESLMSLYKIEEVPTLLIDGKYKTSVSMAGSLSETVTVLNYLVAKAGKAAQAETTSVASTKPATAHGAH